MTTDRPQLMILVAGPYRSGTGDNPAKMAANVAFSPDRRTAARAMRCGVASWWCVAGRRRDGTYRTRARARGVSRAGARAGLRDGSRLIKRDTAQSSIVLVDAREGEKNLIVCAPQ
jgi:hypothetical protein